VKLKCNYFSDICGDFSVFGGNDEISENNPQYNVKYPHKKHRRP
jgi:hypothetical protein